MSTTYNCNRCGQEVDPVTGKILTAEIYTISGALHRPERSFHLCEPCLGLLDTLLERIPAEIDPEEAVGVENQPETAGKTVSEATEVVISTAEPSIPAG